MLTTRQIGILRCLEKRSGYMTTKELADQFDVSSRTVRNDLDMIEYSLKGYPIDLERTPRLGIRLTIQGELNLSQILYRNDLKMYSKEDRTTVIIVLLIMTDKTTIEQLAQELEVSKNTLVEDLKAAEKELNRCRIRLIRKSYYGLSIAGNEEEIRNMIFNQYVKVMNENMINLDEIIKRHAVIDTDIAKDMIRAIEDEQDIKYSDNAIQELENMILVSLSRCFYGFHIVYKKMPDWRGTKEYQIIKDTLDRYHKIHLLEEGDLFYLIMLFHASKKFYGTFLDDNLEDKKIMMITENLIKEFCKVIQIDYEMNKDIGNQIMMHLKVAIYRLKNHIQIENPLEDDIRYSSLIMYDITKKILKEYEEIFGVEFPEAEIAYTTMYFETLFQENYNLKFNIRVILVCNGGISTAVLLKQRLHMMMPELEIIKTSRMKDAGKEAEKERPDFVISTVPLNLEKYKVLEVNPLLGASDLNLIREEISNIYYNKKTEYLAKQISCESQSKMRELLQEKYCRFGEETLDWKEAVKIAAQPLIEDEYIEEAYVEDMINVVQTVGNYMVFIPEIAFVHAPPAHVKKNHMAFLQLKHVIRFGVKSKADVKVMIVVANKNENENLLELIQILTKDDNVKKFKEAKSYEDLLKIN